MNNTGRNRTQSNYLVILLLVVGLTAFSHSMKELSEIPQLFLGGNDALAHRIEIKTPAPPVAPAIVKVETCELQQSLPSVELSWLHNDDDSEPVAVPEVPAPRRPERVERQVRVREVTNHIAKGKKGQVFEFKNLDPMAFEVQIPTEENDEVATPAGVNELPLTVFKVRNRKHSDIRISPRDREMILKTLNRSINLRIAS